VGRRCIGLDVHREFAQVAVWEDGLVRQVGQISLTDESLRIADSLGSEDEVAIEATWNTQAIVRLLEPHVARVVVSNPQKPRAIAETKVKTDRSTRRSSRICWRRTICRRVWVADQATQALRRQVSRRSAHRAPARQVEESGAGHRSPQPDPALPGRGSVRDQGPLLAVRAAAATRRVGGNVEALLRQLDFPAQELRIIDAASAASRSRALRSSG
jgi:transposase